MACILLGIATVEQSCVSQATGTKPTGGALHVEATSAVLLSSALFESNAVLVNSPATPELPSACAHIALFCRSPASEDMEAPCTLCPAVQNS